LQRIQEGLPLHALIRGGRALLRAKNGTKSLWAEAPILGACKAESLGPFEVTLEAFRMGERLAQSEIEAEGLQKLLGDPAVRLRVVLDGQTLRGEHATRAVWVCGPASFTVLKARANHLREKPKDAFDLQYVLANVPAGVSAIAADLRGMMADADAAEAVAFMEHDFKQLDSVGPRRAAYFAYGPRTTANQEDHDLMQASAHAYVQRLLRELR
jgi:hypothetical protein